MKRALPPSFTAGANVPPRRTWATTPFPVREAITAVPSSATAVVASAPGTRTAAPATSANDFRSRLNTITSPPAAIVSAVRAGGSAGTSTPPHALGASAASASTQTVTTRARTGTRMRTLAIRRSGDRGPAPRGAPCLYFARRKWMIPTSVGNTFGLFSP